MSIKFYCDNCGDEITDGRGDAINVYSYPVGQDMSVSVRFELFRAGSSKAPDLDHACAANVMAEAIAAASERGEEVPV